MQFLVQPKFSRGRAVAAMIAGAVVSTIVVSGFSTERTTCQSYAKLQIAERVTPGRAEYTSSPDSFRVCYELVDSRNIQIGQSQHELVDSFLKTALNGRQTAAGLEQARKLMAPFEWEKFQQLFDLAETKLYFVPTEWRWHDSSVSVNGNLVGLTLEEPFINNMYLTFYFSGRPGNYKIESIRTAVDPLLRKFLAGRTGLTLKPEAISEHFAAQKELDAFGDRARAIKHYDRAIKASPDFFFAYFCRGFEKSQLNDHDGAIADYSTAIKLNPRFFSAYLNRSYELNAIKHDFAKAIADCDMAIALEPGQIKPYANKAHGYCELGEYEKAIAACDQAFRSVPEYAGIYLAPVHNLRAYALSQLSVSCRE